MRKTLSVIFALLLILSLSCLTVGAAGNQVSVTSEGVTTEYADYKDGFKAAKAGDTVTLLQDITLYGSESLELVAGADLTVDGNGFTIYSPYNCFYLHKGEETNRVKLTLKNLTINTTEYDTKNCVQMKGYNDLVVENCTLRGNYSGVEVSGTYNTVTVKSSSLYSLHRYGVFGGNCNTYVLENTKIESSEGSCIEVSGNQTPGAELTLTNCDFTANGNFCLWVHSMTKVVIDGGTYTTIGNEKKPGALYLDGDLLDITIKDGTFNCNYASAVTLLSPYTTSKLTIEGGTFNYTGGEAGSALVVGGVNSAGKNCGGILNVTGGTFQSNGTDAVVNVVSDKVVATVAGASFINAGSSTVPAIVQGSNAILSFPKGENTVSVQNTIEIKAAETTKKNEATQDPETTAAPDNSTAPSDTTDAPTTTEPKKSGCGSSAVIGSALLVTVIGAAVIRKKED